MYTKNFEFAIENPVVNNSLKADPAKPSANSSNTFSKFLDLRVCRCNARIYVCFVSSFLKLFFVLKKYFTSITAGIENQKCFTEFLRTKVLFIFLNR